MNEGKNGLLLGSTIERTGKTFSLKNDPFIRGDQQLYTTGLTIFPLSLS